MFWDSQKLDSYIWKHNQSHWLSIADESDI